MPWDQQQQQQARSQPPTPVISPAGSLRGLLSRTLSRGRSAEHVPRRAAKSKPTSPKPKRHLGDPTAAKSPRTRSTTWSDHSYNKSTKDSRFCSRRASSAKNPPPFAEAFRHAILHAKIEMPVANGTLKKDKSAGRSPAVGVDIGASPLIGNGRSSRSNSGSHNLVTKIFILSDDSCILQYHADGPSNRTPERVLELGPQSISVASDAIPGKHWVLNVVYDGRHTLSQPGDTLKPTRPSLFSRRSSEVKKTAREMLLVFNDGDSLDQWLTCVRKEIESLGGLEYRPDSRGAALLLQSGQTAVESSPVSVHFRSAPVVRPLGTPKDTSEFSVPGFGATSPQSTARSSVGTSTDLDRLRDSMVDTRSFGSETGSSYLECSQEQSVPDISVILSEAHHTEPPVSFASPNTRRKKKGVTPIVILPVSRRRSASCSPSLATPQFPRTPTLATDALHGMAGAFQVPPSPVSAVSSAQPDQSPFFFMNKFQFTPYSGAETDTTTPVSDESTSTSMQPTPRDSFSVEEFDRFADDQRPSLDGSPTEEVAPHMHLPPPPYTLAPQRKSSLIFRGKSVCRSSSGGCLLGLGISGQDEQEDSSYHSMTSARGHSHQQLPTSVKPAGLDEARLRELEQSPAITERHFDLDFGFESSDTRPVAAQVEPWLTSARNGWREPEVALTTRTRQPEMYVSEKINRQRSMPNLLCKSTPAPPPSAPLPAIPVQGSRVTDEQRDRPVDNPPVPIEQPVLRHNRSTTLDSPRMGKVSPLSSNPVSPAELKYARRLSTVNGFSPIDAAVFSAEPSAPQEKRSVSKNPPPSTWEVWKKSPKLSSAPTSRRISCWSTMPAAPIVAPPPATSSIDALLPKSSLAAHDEREAPRQVADDDEEEEAQTRTIEVNGFRFPVAR